MQPQQSIRAFYPADIRAMLKGLSFARPDLNEAWAILAQQVGFDNPYADLGIGLPVIIQPPPLDPAPIRDTLS